MSKKILSLLLAMMLVVVFVAGCGASNNTAKDAPKEPEKKADPIFVNIATGGTAGTYYPLGAGMAEIWNNKIAGVNATATSTGASVANTNMLRNGEVDVIFVQNDVAYYAETGTELFKDKYSEIRGLCTLYAETVQIITLDKNIKSIQDLKGKRVAVGAAGSGTEANARQILGEAGITYDDITPQYLSFSEAANNLQDGNVDVAFVTAGFPTAAVQSIAAQHDVVLVPVEADLVEKLSAKYPFYTKTTIPGGTYKGSDADVAAVSVKAMLAVSSKLSDDLAYNMVKALYESPERLEAAHKKGAMIKAETGKEGMSIELHAGAAKYFAEKK